jgi:EmrB/QacA subfamily drug resistance transporter
MRLLPRTSARPALSVPAVAGIVYSAAWIVALALWPSSPGVDASGPRVVAAYSSHELVAIVQFLLAQGVAAAALLVVVIALVRAAPRSGASRRWRRAALTAAILATSASLVQVVLGVVLSASADGAGGTERAHGLFEAINRLDGLKMLALAVVATAGVRLAKGWLGRLAAVLAISLVASGIGYLVLDPTLAAAASVSLALLLVWVTGVGVTLGRTPRGGQATRTGRRLVTAENRKWWTLGAVGFGLFMIMLDNTIVNVALPTIQRELGAGLSQLEWIVSGYALTFAAFMLTGGKLADLFGRRRVFVAGLAVFSGSSLACALAPTAGFLIGARVVQGAGAALMNPATLSIISATFPPRERGTAIGIWAGVSALALAIGPLVGGLLTEHVGWSSIFYVNVPVGVLAIAASLLLIDESRDTSAGQRPDVPGLLSSAVGLLAVTYGLIEANGYGWGSVRIVGAFVVGAVALTAFVLLERHQRAPMLDLRLFRDRTFAGANLLLLLVALAMFGVFFFLSLYMQNVLRYSPVEAGAAFLPLTGLIIVVAPLAGRLSDRFGARWLLTGGMTLVAAQLLYFSRLGLDESFSSLVPGMLLGGAGMGAAMAPATAAGLSGVPVDKAGVGSAVLNSSRQLGGSIGIALMGAIVTHEIGGRATATAFVHGLSVALEVAAAIAVVAAVVAAALVRPHLDLGALSGPAASAEGRV